MAFIQIEDVIGLGDFATLHRWNMVFTPIALLGSIGNTGMGSSSLQQLNVRCESATLPKKSTPATEQIIRGHKVKHPGIADYGNQITLTLVETNDMYVTRVIKAWSELCWQTSTGITQNKDDLKTIITLERMNNKNQFMYSYQLYGCFMEDYDHGGDLGADNADAQKPTMTISFDYFKEIHNGQQLRNIANGFGSGANGSAPTNFV